MVFSFSPSGLGVLSRSDPPPLSFSLTGGQGDGIGGRLLLYIVEVGLVVGFALVVSGHVSCLSMLLMPVSGSSGHVELLLLAVVAWSHMRWRADAPASRRISSRFRLICEDDAELRFLAHRGGEEELRRVDMHLPTVFPLAGHGGEGGRSDRASSSSIRWSSGPPSLGVSSLEQGFVRQFLS